MRRFALLALLAIGGCGPFWVNPYVEVTDSQLNWMEIHYYNMNRTPVRRVWVYLNGTGHVETKRGTSQLVSNDFARRYDEEDWSDIRTQRFDVDPKHIRDTFQHLVNSGVLDREKIGRKAKKEKFDRFIAVKANISNITYSDHVNIFEVDPDLAEQLLDVVREFTTATR